MFATGKKKSTKNKAFKPADSTSQKTESIHYKIQTVKKV
jgi:hypothetical protein